MTLLSNYKAYWRKLCLYIRILFFPDTIRTLVYAEWVTPYLVTSTFEYFPGVPIYKSRNLINWELIGHCLTRDSQLPLQNCRVSGGIYAPTIRYHDGVFFMVTTNVTSKGNFIVHAKDPAGEWSEPAWVKQRGIDPSLLFEDGKVYFVSTGDCEGNRGIYLCEVNPFTGEMLTESVWISEGCGGRFPEAPHLYKIKDIYYLLLAEGGTEYGHMVTLQRSSSIYGPYESCPYNPILSHKDEESMDIVCTGHADIVEDPNGNWWLTALGVRTLSYDNSSIMLHNLGRETFLAPMNWREDGWPVVGNNGCFALAMEGDLPGRIEEVATGFTEYFNGKRWNLEFAHIRNPYMENYSLDSNHRSLHLKGTDIQLSTENGHPTFLGARQTAFEQSVKVTMIANGTEADMAAGLTAFYNNEHHYEIMVCRKSGKKCIAVRKQIYDFGAITKYQEIEEGKAINLKIEADKEYYRLSYQIGEQPYHLLDRGTTAALSTEITRRMTFTGTFFGMFAENTEAVFQLFELK